MPIRPIIVTCALTGGADTAGRNPAVPVTPEEIAASAIAAGDAGAAVVHVHVRDPKTRLGTMEYGLYEETTRRIRAARPGLLINLTTGAGALLTAAEIRDGSASARLASPRDRVSHVQKLRPEICSLDIATMNFGDRIYVNSLDDLAEMAGLIAKSGVKPELEAFDFGHLRVIDHLIRKGILMAPPMIQICLGVLGGAPSEPAMMVGMVQRLPPDTIWAGFGIGAQQFPMAAQSILLGGHVRVGLEDNLYIEHGVLAPSNAALVSKAVSLIELLGGIPATPTQARELLGLARG
jgi:uncharacterized protein (DUF849 family)